MIRITTRNRELLQVYVHVTFGSLTRAAHSLLSFGSGAYLDSTLSNLATVLECVTMKAGL
jgi:hypothetical protein